MRDEYDPRFADPIPTPQVSTAAGMSLRDYFAAHAMGALVASGRWAVGLDVVGESGSKPHLAHHAYQLADAMLEARKS